MSRKRFRSGNAPDKMSLTFSLSFWASFLDRQDVERHVPVSGMLLEIGIQLYNGQWPKAKLASREQDIIEGPARVASVTGN